MNLNLILDPTNWLEATWFEQTSAPDTVIPAKAAVLDEDGNEVSPAESERIEPGQVTKTQIKCVSYHPTQIDMLRADAAVAQADRATQIEWEYATEVRRDWPTLLTLQTELGLSEQQVNDLFISAALI